MFNIKSGVLQVAMLVRGIIAGLVIAILVMIWHHGSSEEGKELKVGFDGMECVEAFQGEMKVPCEEISLAYDDYVQYFVGEHEARLMYEGSIGEGPRFAGAGWSENGNVYTPPQE